LVADIGAPPVGLVAQLAVPKRQYSIIFGYAGMV
jgi:hypothetical protein